MRIIVGLVKGRGFLEIDKQPALKKRVGSKFGGQLKWEISKSQGVGHVAITKKPSSANLSKESRLGELLLSLITL